MRHGPSTGFTLIELAIVLVIIGLVIGGVVVGRDLIYAAQLRQVSSEYQFYGAAFNVFRDKYRAWPGDYREASVALGGGAANGNGDGMIAQWQESNYAWKHLSLAHLIPGSYNGIGGSGNVGGVNVPASSYKNHYVYTVEKIIPGDWGYTDHFHSGNYISTHAETTINYYPAYASGLNAKDAQAIDIKLDDGLANSGRIVQWKYAVCVNTTTFAYVTTQTSNYCATWFDLGF